MQISHEAGKVVWYSHLLKDFPQFIVIHRVKGFGIVNKAEVNIFLELSCCFDDSMYIGNLIWLLGFFYIQLERVEIHSSCAVKAWLGEF